MYVLHVMQFFVKQYVKQLLLGFFLFVGRVRQLQTYNQKLFHEILKRFNEVIKLLIQKNSRFFESAASFHLSNQMYSLIEHI